MTEYGIASRMRRIGAAASLVALTAAGLATIAPAPAQAWTQPYGGCKEAARYTHSPGAHECRVHGWTIRPRLIVTPRGHVVMSRLPHCREEDGSGQRGACSWNIGPRRDGNGRGLAYWLDEHDRTHYVVR